MQSKFHISIDQLPIFHNYLYNFIKDEGDYQLSFEFIKENFYIVGYCGCKQKDCASVSLRSRVSISKYEVSKLRVPHNKTVTEHFHVDENGMPIEFEYIDGYDCPYKSEVYSAVDKMFLFKKILEK